jgi:DNA-binding MarR family transcriptional regulator
LEPGISERSIGVALIRAYEWFDDALIAWMHANGHPELTRSTSMIFSYLDPEGSRPAELARRIGISRQAVHRTLAEMVEIGLVTLASDPTDQRAKVVLLTPLGRTHVVLARRRLAELERELEARIGSDRMAGLREALAAEWGDPPVALVDSRTGLPE